MPIRLPENGYTMSWECGWEQKISKKVKVDVSQLSVEVQELIEKADSKEKVLDLINKLESIVWIDENNYNALWTLGRYCQLMVVGYSNNIKEKEKYCRLGIQYCERAMSTNKEFKKAINRGLKLWEAVSFLTRNEIEAMYYWYANVGSYWKEYLNPIGKVLNIKWTFRTKHILKRMMLIDPEWGGGHPYFAFAVYYTLTPGFGNLNKAEEYFKKAVETGPKWLYTRWGRAKYFFTAKKDREAFRKDLEFIISEDPHKADSPYPWNVYFQRSAKEMLENMESYNWG